MRQSTRNILFLSPVVRLLRLVCAYTDVSVGAAPLSRSDTTAPVRSQMEWNGHRGIGDGRRGKKERDEMRERWLSGRW